MKDYYRTLQVHWEAEQEVISAAYRRLAQKYHPDQNPQTEERMKEINEAYEVLGDPEKRKVYDNKLFISEKHERADPRSSPKPSVSDLAIGILSQVPGMTKAHHRDFNKSNPQFILRDGSVVKTWKNPVGVDHVFIADKSGKMIFSGFVGWIHSDGFHEAVSRIQKEFS